MRKKENAEMIEKLSINKLSADLGKKKDKPKEKVQEDDDSMLEFDREYIPGHDSLSEDEKDTAEVMSKQVRQRKKIKLVSAGKKMNNTAPRRTRSATTPSQVKI